MLKKLSVAVGLILLALPLGCVLSTPFVDEVTDILTSEDVESLAMQDDFLDGFYIIFSYYAPNSMKPMLDTKNNIIGVMTYSGYVSVDYCMPLEKLQELHNFIIQYDIKSYSSPDLLAREDGVMLIPTIHSGITFSLDGEIYSIWFDESVVDPASRNLPEKYHNLRSFIVLLEQPYLHTNEYKSLPAGVPIY